MQSAIFEESKDPLGAMARDYLQGKEQVRVRVDSSCVDMGPMSGNVLFRTLSQMDAIERKALDLCRGHILDVGAGAGCHSLELQLRKQKVTALDISPGCVNVMIERGVKQVRHAGLLQVTDQPFDTLLMLMNGIGICGTLKGLHSFLDHALTLLTPGGQILADSTDLSVFMDDTNMPDPDQDIYWGQVDFMMHYKTAKSSRFDWLYIDFATLAHHAQICGLSCERVLTGEQGKYLARIMLP